MEDTWSSDPIELSGHQVRFSRQRGTPPQPAPPPDAGPRADLPPPPATGWLSRESRTGSRAELSF